MSGDRQAGGGHRRASRRQVRRSRWQAPVAAATLLVMTASLLGWTSSREPAPPSVVAGARQVPVDAASMTCHGLSGRGDSPAGVLSTLVDRSVSDAAADVDVSATVLRSGRDRPRLLPTSPGELILNPWSRCRGGRGRG